MAKLIGFFLLIVALPLGLVALVVLLISLRFHAATPPCLAHTNKPVVIAQWTYLDIELPRTSLCVERYKG